ncbi:hypothetical protein Hanom_Chr14g01273881 [Helianthus anomalus]
MWNNSGPEMWNNNGGPSLAPPGTGGVGGLISPPLAAQPWYTVLSSPTEAEARLEEKARKWMQLNSKRYGDKGSLDLWRRRRKICRWSMSGRLSSEFVIFDLTYQ